jgi:uncharacterized protein YodC (DUF2158 family)
MKFQLGDVVILNSGGPAMTVIGLGSDNRAQCKWKRADGQDEEASFPVEAIRLAPTFIQP